MEEKVSFDRFIDFVFSSSTLALTLHNEAQFKMAETGFRTS